MTFPPAFRLLSLSLLAASPCLAQAELLREDFESGLFPPSGWTQVRNNSSSLINWALHDVYSSPYPYSGIEAWSAYHDYGAPPTVDDNLLVTPPLDLTGLASVWLHFYEYVIWASYRGHHWIDVSLDGGATWSHAAESLAPGDTPTYSDFDLSSLAGVAGVLLACRYEASDGAGWFVDEVVVNDSAATPPPEPSRWLVNLPGEFAAAAGFNTNFDLEAGVLPAYMAVTEIDAWTGQYDEAAWCNVGQRGPCTGGLGEIDPYSGDYQLEMGRNPTLASTFYSDVRNALVVALDGMGAADLRLAFRAINHGDEYDEFDGVWLSSNGRDWHRLLHGWESIGGGYWHPETTVLDMTGTAVSLAKKFYLMFAQEDNYPLGIDGVQIDNVVISGQPTFSLSALKAGRVATAEFQGFTQNGTVILSYSLTGGGPTSTSYGTALLSEPIYSLPAVTADNTGAAVLSLSVPAGTAGIAVWLQALDLVGSSYSNGVHQIVG